MMTKNRVLLLMTLLLAAVHDPAPAAAQVEIGARAGLALADQSVRSGEVRVRYDDRSAITAGLFMRVPAGRSLYVQPELLYAPRGLESEDVAVALDYLELPLLVGARFRPADSPVRPHLAIGPALGVRVRCNVAGEDCSDGYSSFDFGIVFGVGVRAELAAVSLHLDARYGLGLVDVLDVAGFEEVSAKNRSWQFFVGVGWRLGD